MEWSVETEGPGPELSPGLTWVSGALSTTNEYTTCSQSCSSFGMRAICQTQKEKHRNF